MVDPHHAEDIDPDRERSLQNLARALSLSQGEFQLILVLCNYASLQKQILHHLRERCCLKISEIDIPKSVTQLHATILTAIANDPPQALMVLGLESAIALDDLLVCLNRMRDQFCQTFSFPVVFWVTDMVLHKLTRLAPDFKSFAAPAIKFEIPIQQLIDLLKKEADALFAKVLQVGESACSPKDIVELPTSKRRQEIENAMKDLQTKGVSLDPALLASLQFVQGREAFINDELERSRQLYEQSLVFWQQEIGTTSYLERQGCLHFYLGIWWLRSALLHRSQFVHACRQARDRLQQCVEIFQQLQRPDLVAKFINALAEAHKRLQDWDRLEIVAAIARDLHQVYPHPVRLAHACGLLAEVALVKSTWQEARQYAETAIESLKNAGNLEAPPDVEELGPNLAWARRYHWSWYLLLLGRAHFCLGQVREAIENLEQAKADCNYQYTPQLYTEILDKLRSLYFDEGHYLAAFALQQEKSSIEQQYGFQSFIGAGCLQPQRKPLHPARDAAKQVINVAREITQTRRKDVNSLLDRLSRSDRKLIVIYGQAGVGKSSLLNAGLVPELKQRMLGDRIALPVVLSVYTDWVKELRGLLTEALEGVEAFGAITDVDRDLYVRLDSVEAISEELRNNSERHLLTVLIFDQFEEFLCGCTDTEERQKLWGFLCLCLNLSFVKVILSVREDCLHYLWDWERDSILQQQPRFSKLDAIDNDILDRDILYYLGYFSTQDAKLLMQIKLDPDLIEKLVEDLAGNLGSVRPIELQIVGVQLQAENITTLEKYQQNGSKEKLIERFLESAIRDCGKPNEQLARMVLYLLTGENGALPLIPRAELLDRLKSIGIEAENLDLVLTILVGKGVVFRMPKALDNRYQLVGDYVVSFCRRQNALKV